jgi:amino-acid N-acetyltransferase
MAKIALHMPPTPRADGTPIVRRAHIDDVEHMGALVNGYANQGIMLPKTPAQLFNNLRDFIVADADGQVVGCAGLKILWRDMAEIVSLAVHPEWQGRGLGRRLCEPLIEDAQALGIATVLALTYQVPFFHKLGFEIVPRHNLSQKVWQDCQFCAKHDCCDEIAMILKLNHGSTENTKKTVNSSLSSIVSQR